MTRIKADGSSGAPCPSFPGRLLGYEGYLLRVPGCLLSDRWDRECANWRRAMVIRSVSFPSWTSRVRVPSPAPSFEQLSASTFIPFYLVYLENPVCLKNRQRQLALPACGQ